VAGVRALNVIAGSMTASKITPDRRARRTAAPASAMPGTAALSR
jgi:hypothetical protein